MTLPFVAYFITINCLVVYCLAALELRQVNILFRHGARTPIYIYPKDINQMDKWLLGSGQLTSIGINQQFKLGKWLRSQYDHLLGPKFNSSLIYVRSTDYDRTLMSAQSNMAGLFYNQSDVISELRWRPVPVHTVRKKSDYKLEGQDDCPRYKQILDELYKSDYAKRKYKPFNSLLEMIRQNSGAVDLTFQNVWRVYDCIICEKTENMKVNDWVTKSVWENMTKMNFIEWELNYHGDLAKLVGGYLLHTIIEHFTNISQGKVYDLSSKKMIVYSAHDTDVAPILRLLGIIRGQPMFASCVLFELYYDSQSVDDKWKVQIRFKNSTVDQTASAEIIEGCGGTSFCSLNTFVELMRDKVLTETEYEQMCSIKEYFDIFLYVKVLFIVLCVVFVIIIVFMLIYQKKRTISSINRYSRIERTDIN